MSKVNNSNIIWEILVSLTLSVVAILIPTAAFADSGENIFTYLFGQLYGNEYDARIPYEGYNNNGEIRFNDKWLTQDTTQYNNALSSFCANCSEKIEQDKDSINNYLKENNLGVAYFGGDEKPNGWSGFYCISHKIVVIDGKQSVVLFICCRGTQRLSEVIGDYFRGDNVNFLNSQIYDNVYDFEENVYEGLISYSENHYIDENHFVKLKDIMSNNLKVIVTGHSLGGAAANAVAAKLNYEAGYDNWWLHKIKKSDVYAYTYGAIKVLGDNYNDDTNLEDGYENIHNVYNWSDSFGPNGSRKNFYVSVPKKKFGHTETFDIDKHDFGLWLFPPFESTYSASHNMPTYIEAINNETITNNKNDYHYLELSCNNKLLKDLSGEADGRIWCHHGLGIKLSLPEYWRDIDIIGWNSDKSSVSIHANTKVSVVKQQILDDISISIFPNIDKYQDRKFYTKTNMWPTEYHKIIAGHYANYNEFRVNSSHPNSWIGVFDFSNDYYIINVTLLTEYGGQKSIQEMESWFTKI